MARPPKSQILLEVKATEKAESPQGKAQKRHLLVTAHRLWIDEGREILLADLLSVRLSANDTVSVRQIGETRPTELQCRKPGEAQNLRACLVFHAKYTRGGLRGVETWQQLTSAPYDRIDISDAVLPAAASPAVGAAVAASAVARASRSRRSAVVAAIVAVVVIAAIAVMVVSATRSSGVKQPRGASAAQLEAARAADEASNRGDYAQAAREYRTALEGSPRSAELLAGLGGSLFHQARFSEAVGPLEESLTYSTTPQADTSAMLAMCYLETQQVPQSLRVLQRARRDFPDDTELTFLMAKTLSLRGPNDATAALKLSRKVFEDQPDHLQNARLYASLLDGAGLHRQAIQAHLAVAHGAKDYASFVSAARSAGKAGRIEEAAGIIRETRRVFPQHAELKDRTNDQVLIALGIMEAPSEPESEPVTKEPATQDGTGPETKTPGTETHPDSETHPGTETPPTKEPGAETHPPDDERTPPAIPDNGEERPAPPETDEPPPAPAPPVENKPAEGDDTEPEPAT